MRSSATGLAFAVLLVGAAGCTAKSQGAQATSPVVSSTPGDTDSTATDSTNTDSTATDSAGTSDTATDDDSATDSQTATDSDTATDSPSSTAPTTTPASRAPRTRAPSASSPTSVPAGLAACGLPYLRVTAKSGGAGMSHAGYVLIYTNTGQVPCTMTGYPGVAVLNAVGKQVLQASRTPSGYLGGVKATKPPFPVAVLNGGESASALLEGEVLGAGGQACPTERGLLTTPPGTRTSAKLAVSTIVCGHVVVHPVIPGSTGSER